MKLSRKKLLSTLLVFFILFIFACFLFSRSIIHSGTPRVVIDHLSYGNLHKKYSLQGRFQSSSTNDVIVYSENRYEAEVLETYCSAGDYVEEGQLLYTCRVPLDLVADVEAAKAELDSARLDILQQNWDADLYAAYEQYIVAEDRCMLDPEDHELQEDLATAKECLRSLVQTKEQQDQLEKLRRKRNTLIACENEYLKLVNTLTSLESVCATNAGTILERTYSTGDVLSTDKVCAVISSSEILVAKFHLTQEQAAFFLANEGIMSCQTRIGNAIVNNSTPIIGTDGTVPCFEINSPYSSAIYNATATLDIEFLTTPGILIPRTALKNVEGRTSSFYTLGYRDGFFGREAFVKEVSAVITDWDDDYAMLKTSLPVETEVVKTSTKPLQNDLVVLVTVYE